MLGAAKKEKNVERKKIKKICGHTRSHRLLTQVLA
jgi:hypothetical protein